MDFLLIFRKKNGDIRNSLCYNTIHQPPVPLIFTNIGETIYCGSRLTITYPIDIMKPLVDEGGKQ